MSLRVPVRVGALLVAVCRTAYCWIFFTISLSAIYVVATNIMHLARAHSVDKGDMISNLITAIYSIIWGLAWWMIFRGKSASKPWAIAANAVIIFNYLPVLPFEGWRNFLRDELAWWPFASFGIVGIIIFSIPYYGWRDDQHIP